MRPRTALAAFLLLSALSLAACAGGLPEPESRPARLYVEYCAGSGCHDPIPPQRDGVAYWNNQYARMIDLMRRQGRDLPSPQEEQVILDYLHQYAAK